MKNKGFGLFQITLLISVFCSIFFTSLWAQQITELNSGWFCKNIQDIHISGQQLTLPGGVNTEDWMPAVVPGTVLTTLLENGKVPDPFIGMNNDLIEDIYDTGRDHYTYWFYKEFSISQLKKDEQQWLHFRGVNYSCEIFLNGQKLNPETHHGMFLRQTYSVTEFMKQGKNSLAVLILPPDPVGNPNGGQAGDGRIAKNVMHQYVAGWDWIQPVRDRNTGIWDKVQLETTGHVNIKNPHVVTLVPGKRFPGLKQAPSVIKVSVELKNAANKVIKGKLSCQLENQTISADVKLLPFEEKQFTFQDIVIQHPKLWWPNGYGDQPLYDLSIDFQVKKAISDRETLRFGIREISTEWNPVTRSTQVLINGQKIFIKGGNWIISDAMLRFSEERYDAEIRMHKDMNLNCIRIWGGAITERPEFYAACDKYGILVMQDFWISGDGNGRWLDRRKKEDQWTRRQYPDDHSLFLKSAADQIKMIRNHPSLAFWCGGNEMGPSEDILFPLRDTLEKHDGTRWFVEYSTSDSMSFNFIGGNGDGPYGIQPINRFFEYRTFPFNSEVGSVGVPDYEGLRRFMEEDDMIIPGKYKSNDDKNTGRWRNVHPVWLYHKYLPYGDYLSKYGEPKDVADFAFKAQLVNYDQYRALIEGFSSHMWEWYSGVIIWKTQNPWTAMRGQMYDCYLDQNAGLYGLNHGSEALHIFFDPVKEQVMIANNTFEFKRDLMIEVTSYNMAGEKTLLYQEFVSIGPTVSKRFGTIGRRLESLKEEDGIFLRMKLMDIEKQTLSENFYWLPNEKGEYSGLQKLQTVKLEVSASITKNEKVELVLKNHSSQNPVSFFNRISIIDQNTGERALPVFYSDNYVSILPAEEKLIWIDLKALPNTNNLKIQIKGWNTETINIELLSKIEN
ncbi:MAG: glycosyl hydrolase [Bacteroidetes bacterium]|nr:glycosyl hydrolase [Bacteroidota bacterium]